MNEEHRRLDNCRTRIPALVARRMTESHLRLQSASQQMRRAVGSLMMSQRHRLELLAQRLRDASPERLLKRGYTITVKDGRPVKSVEELKSGDTIVTRMKDGEVKSTIE
jgi:exodeoxyribonuclease VII large subunit